MTDCQLPSVGGSTHGLLLLAGLVLGIGIPLLLIVRRRGIGAGAVVLVALAVGGSALTVGDARYADATACPPTTTGVAPVTTAAPSTTAAATTTTVATTTTAAATTTTVAPLADLTPSIVGPTSGFSGRYIISIANTGDAPTAGPMTFALALTVLNGPGPVLPDLVVSADWTSTIDPSGLTFTSNAGLVIAPGATSIVSLLLEWRVDEPGSWRGTVTLPTGIGGETNATNNIDSITVVIPPPPP